MLFLLEHYWVLTGRNYKSLANMSNNGQSCFLLTYNWLRMSVLERKGDTHFFLLEICVTVFLIFPRSGLLVAKFPTFNSGGLHGAQDSWMITSHSWVNFCWPHPLPFPFVEMESPLIFSSWRACMNPPSFAVFPTPAYYSPYLSSLFSEVERVFIELFHFLGCRL